MVAPASHAINAARAVIAIIIACTIAWRQRKSMLAISTSAQSTSMLAIRGGIHEGERLLEHARGDKGEVRAERVA